MPMFKKLAPVRSPRLRSKSLSANFLRTGCALSALISSSWLIASPVFAQSTQASAESTATPQTIVAASASEKDPDKRADMIIAKMSMKDKIQTVFSYFSTDADWLKFTSSRDGRPLSAGYAPPITSIGFPAQFQTDAGLGVASQGAPKKDIPGEVTPKPIGRTALPSGMATAATFNRRIALAGGTMIGNEARLSGFNVQLAGGINLVREPRNGRNFEYAGEDPLLAGEIVGYQIKGVQSNQIVSTIKHFALNNQETARKHASITISDQAARTSDLLAFQIAIEIAEPGSVMCSYNRVGGVYACESDYLLNQVLKTDWGYKGYVMSDWGAQHSTVAAANAGLDQQSGYPFDASPYFNDALREAVINGHVTEARFNDMVHRVLRSFIKAGVLENPVSVQPEKIDFAAHASVTQADAEEAIVLLKNSRGLLPLAKTVKKIAIIGAHADVGVLSGGGSSQVYPVGGMAVPNEGPKDFPGPKVFYPSSPMKALAAKMGAAKTGATITYIDGKDKSAAARLAAQSDVVIVFAEQWIGEELDATSLNLPDNQDKLIFAVAKANKNTVVVLQNSGPVVMPWLSKVGAVVEAWYPGTSGGEAIANVLTGQVNPSGHLPVTFPQSESQLPFPKIQGDPKAEYPWPVLDYNVDGAAVGYKWFDLKGHKPLFAFGYGLSYTSFAYSGLSSELKDGNLHVSFSVKNTGMVAGKDAPQVYVAPVAGGWEAPKRLGGFDKVDLKPNEDVKVNMMIDSRLLAVFDSATKTWKIAEGDYNIILSEDALKPVSTIKVHLPARTLNVRGQ